MPRFVASAVTLLLCGAVAAAASSVVPLKHHPHTKLIAGTNKRVAGTAAGRPYAPDIGVPVALNGSVSYGEYYIDIEVGTGKPSFLVQVDSGSSDFAVISNKVSAEPSLPHYNPSGSTTSAPVPASQPGLHCPNTTAAGDCAYQISYLDGSGFFADLYTDELTVGAATFKGYVGAITQMSSGFEAVPVAGIVGVAFPSVSETGAPTVMDSMVAALRANDVFSLCLLPSPLNGGAMVVGETGVPDPLAINYTSILSKDFYTVHVESVSVAGKPLDVPSHVYNANTAVVDSGTTDFALPDTAYTALYNAFMALCGQGVDLPGVCGVSRSNSLFNNYCFAISKAQMDNFPSVSVTMTGVTVDVPPASYLPVDAGQTNLRCFGIVGLPDSDPTIMGDVVMRGSTTVFDRSQMRVGFLPNNGVCTLTN